MATVLEHMLEHHAPSIAEQKCLSYATYVRNERTYVETTHLSNYLPLGNARRGGTR